MKDIEGRPDIKIFVDEFYNQVRQDKLLAPVFASKIASDDWAAHLNRMYDFWGSVLFFEQAYKGNPFSKHINLPISQAHFSQWIHLFAQSIDKHFAGDKAEETKQRAQKIALMFQSKLEYFSKNPEKS